MANPWFKFYGADYLSDPKISSLSPQDRSCWITLLCLAGMSSEPGTIRYLSVDALLQQSGIRWNPYDSDEWDMATTALDRFERMGMIIKNPDGTIVLKNWEKRQEHNLTVAERVAKHRLNKKVVTTDVTNVTTEQNRIDKNTSEPEVRVESFFPGREEEPRARSKPKYPHAKEVFSWFPSPEKNWVMNTTELKHAELLYERGEDKVKKALVYHEKHKDDEGYGFTITSPSELERKWNKIAEYARKTK